VLRGETERAAALLGTRDRYAACGDADAEERLRSLLRTL
jgi:hypothetical protein